MKHPVLIPGIVVLGLLAVFQPASADTSFSLDGPSRVRPVSEATYALRATLTDPVNAVAVTVTYDPRLVRVVRFAAGDSIIRNWLERSVSSSSVHIEGIIPGGTAAQTGGPVPIGYLTVTFTREGKTELTFRDPEVYLNRAVPTRDVVRTEPLTITVTAAAPETAGTETPVIREEASASVFRTPEFSDDAWSLAFDIRTADGPLSTVLLRERFLGLFGTWREISSPASLSDQSRLSILEIGIPAESGARVVYREVPVRLVVLASLLGIAAFAFAVRRRMKH